MAKNGLHLITPTSIAYTGTSASISANGSVTFSACSVLSLNGVFSADYDNYQIVMQNSGSNAGPAVYARLRLSGTDATTGYTWQYVYANSTSVTGARNTTEGFARIGQTDSAQRSGLVAWFYGPHLAQPTAIRNVCGSGQNNANLIDYASTHSTSTAYDGLTVSLSGGTFTGRVAVYGMRK